MRTVFVTGLAAACLLLGATLSAAAPKTLLGCDVQGRDEPEKLTF